MKNLIRITIVVGLLILLSACAAGPNIVENIPNEDNEIAGFWQGVWHGVVSPITFIISLFNDDVRVYEVHNNGGLYNFGFLLGASIIFGGSGGGAARRRK